MIKNNIYINEPLCNEKHLEQIKPICASTLISNKKQQLSKCAKLITSNANNNKANIRRSGKIQPQSIRLQIELPIQMSNTSEDESNDEVSGNGNTSYANNNELTFVTDNYEPIDDQGTTKTKKNSINTIRFQISFDSSSNGIMSPRLSSVRNSSRKQPLFANVQMKKNDESSRASSQTSGYFSSSSDYNETDTDNDGVFAHHNFHYTKNPNLSLNLDNIPNICQKRRNSINAIQDSKTKVSRSSNRYTANLYDKLDHATITKRRYSLSSDSNTTTSSSRSSSSSSLASVIMTQKHSSSFLDNAENIYEDISNFCSKEFNDTSSSKRENYEKLNEFASSQSPKFKQIIEAPTKPTTTRTLRSSFKREYTVNEIFQNLKSFKEQAGQLEKLYEQPGAFSKSNNEQPQKKSVAALKQIFESSHTSSITSNASILKRIQKVKQMRGFKNEAQTSKVSSSLDKVEKLVQHTYVNERISTPVNI